LPLSINPRISYSTHLCARPANGDGNLKVIIDE